MIFIYVVVWAWCDFQIKQFEEDVFNSIQDSQNIIATYPTHAHHQPETAKLLFQEFNDIGVEYAPFVGFRRSKFVGEFVATDGVANTRKSTNHSTNSSYWFLGSSLVWGPGLAEWETIPSQFSQIADSQVLNLGEISYNSLQNFIHLKLMLRRGLRPKHVFVLNAGVDLFNYCGASQQLDPLHAASNKFSEIFENFRRSRLQKAFANETPNDRRAGLRQKIISVLTRPVDYFSGQYKIILKQRLDVQQVFKSEFTFSETISDLMTDRFSLKCGLENIEQAADQIVWSWLSMKQISELYEFSISFHLLPTAHYKPAELNLSYLHDYNKKYIVDFSADYEELYKQIRSKMTTLCRRVYSCDDYDDLTEMFVGKRGAIFIDSDHVSNDGANIIASRMYDYIEDNY